MNTKRIDSTLHTVHPISAGFAVPVFAFFAAGVSVQGLQLSQVTSSPLALGVILGLVVGKPIGVVATSWLLSKFTRARLSTKLSWWDVSTIGILAGVGFTVSLLINELAFKSNHETASVGTLAVLIASTISAVLAVIAIQFRNRAHKID
jgi:NhaA family Na+:H+ antiporter